MLRKRFYLSLIPNLIVTAPKDENELGHLLYTAVEAGHPMAVRYPRSAGVGVAMDDELHTIAIGKGEVLRQGEDIALLTLGAPVYPALEAAEELASSGVRLMVANCRFAKPLDSKLVLGIARRVKKIVTIEENTLCGGFGASVCALLQSAGVSDVRVKSMGIPDVFVEHGTPAALRAKFNLDAEGIARETLEFLSGERTKQQSKLEAGD